MDDIIVVGSGIAGLTSALLCAQAGLKVKILEQAPYLGGLLISYTRKERVFATGVHYIGLAAPDRLLGRLWNSMGILPGLPLKLLDEASTDILHYPNYRLSMPTNKEEFIRTLCYYFPGQEKIAEAYLARMEKICKGLALYNLLPMTSESFAIEDFEPLSKWLKRLGATDSFISAVGYISFLHGLDPDTCPVYAHMIIHDSFLHGTHRFIGGSKALIEAFVRQLSIAGATWELKAKVTEISREVGGLKVTTEAGQEFMAKKVIFTGDIGALPQLLAKTKFKLPEFVNQLKDVTYTSGILGVAVSLPGDIDLTGHNHYLYNSINSSDHLRQNLCKNEINGLFISADEKGCANILATMSGSDVASLSTLSKPEYQQTKNRLAQLVLQKAQEFLPDLKDGKIADVFTPLTFTRYSGIKGGSAYGVAKTVEQVRKIQITPSAKIPGLYLAGQSVILPGVVGASISAMTAVSMILGPDWVKKV